MTRLIYVTATLPLGTGEAFLVPEVDELIRLGCDIKLVPRSPQGNYVHNDVRHLQERSLATPLFSLQVLSAAVFESLRRPVQVLQALGMVFRSRGITTIARNLAVFPKGLWLAGIARRWKADHIHAHWLSTPATMAMVASRLSGVPWSCTSHRVDIVQRNLLPQKSAGARFIRFISESGRAMAVEFGMGNIAQKAIVLHIGVDMQTGRQKAVCSMQKASPPTAVSRETRENCLPPTLLCPANLYPVKGHKYLIQAAAILRDRDVDCLVRIAGRGECQKELEQLTSELNLADRVQFLGQVSHDDILGMYRDGRVQLVVLPSVDLGNHLHEGIPVSLMEAMAHGLPVIGTNTGGIPELLNEGAGVIVEEKNPAALADAIEKLIVDAGHRNRVAAAGRERVCKEFEVRSIAAELLRCIQGRPKREQPAGFERAAK